MKKSPDTSISVRGFTLQSHKYNENLLSFYYLILTLFFFPFTALPVAGSCGGAHGASLSYFYLTAHLVLFAGDFRQCHGENAVGY